MNKRIIYTRPDGGMSVVIPAISGDDPAGMTEEQAVARALARDIPPDAADVAVVDVAAVPEDRTFRNAWERGGATVRVSMPKARAIHMGRIRAARAPELTRLDVESLRAIEAGDQAGMTAIASQKQRLRDLPQTFDLTAAKTPEELKASWPADLPRA